MSLASDELDESQITAMDLPLEFKVNFLIFHINLFNSAQPQNLSLWISGS